jgi:hypothetical protein
VGPEEPHRHGAELGGADRGDAQGIA